jgi:outer membrane protein insertion porin family
MKACHIKGLWLARADKACDTTKAELGFWLCASLGGAARDEDQKVGLDGWKHGLEREHERRSDFMRSVMTGARNLFIASALAILVPVTLPGAPLLGAVQAKADVVSSIVVRGNQRVEAETVRSYVLVRPGQSFGAREIDESLKALFATGLFSDVQITRGGGALVVTVVESPLINRVAFEGNKRIPDEQLSTVIESRPRGLLSRSRVQSDVQRILEVYRRAGRFQASVEPKIIELTQNRVDLVYEVNDGDKTGISRIDFVGNAAFSDGRLRDVIRTRETGLLSFLRTTDTYDQDRLNADQELLRRFYTRNGYADFRVISANADLDRERNTFFVSFTVEEGQLYRFGAIDIQSSLPELDPARLNSVVLTREGAVYSAEDIEKTMEAISIEASRMGYAFAQVRPRATRDAEGQTISITYYVDEGPRVYVERIEVRGNTRTRDFVIRREFDLVEGDAFNRTLVDRAERRLRNLQFFKNVRISTTQGTAPDRVIIVVDVDEQATGDISFGVGYSSTDGVIGDISLTEKNFLGRGQYLRVSFGGGTAKRNAEFSFTEPFFLGRRLSAGFDLYQRVQESNSFQSYDEETRGGGIRFGLPIDDAWSVGVGYQIYTQMIGVSRSQLDGVGSDDVSWAIKQFICGSANITVVAGVPRCNAGSATSREVLISQFSWNVTYNTVDSPVFPRSGVFAQLKQDIAGLGGDVGFVKTTVEARIHRELLSDFGLTGMLRGRAGHMLSIGNGHRIFDQFNNGSDLVRGFAPSGFGPRTADTQEAIGGRMFVAATAQVDFPIPGLPEELGLYGSAFGDAGAIWDADTSLLGGAGVINNDFKIRSSVGVGILWRSPFGPLRFDLAYPLMKENGDKTQLFRFSGGTQF